MLKDVFFAAQITFLFFSGCIASDFCYKGVLPGKHTALIIIACVMSIYSSLVFYSRLTKSEKENKKG